MSRSDENFIEATFLIVDDDYIDREMFVRILKKQKISNPRWTSTRARSSCQHE